MTISRNDGKKIRGGGSSRNGLANTKLMPTAPISLDQHLSLNYSKYGLRLKLMLGGLLIYIVWDTNLGAFQLLHFPFLTYARLWKGHLLDQCGSGISGPVIGMIFGANHAVMSLFIQKIEKQSLKEIVAKGVVGLALLMALYMLSSGPLQYDRFEFNDIHGYFGFIPVLGYIYMRNAVPMQLSNISHLDLASKGEK
jgi:hypothetical protein